MTSTPRADVVVIGAGITGAATAAALAEQGLTVVVVEKEAGPAYEGSGRAMNSRSAAASPGASAGSASAADSSASAIRASPVPWSSSSSARRQH